jgi:MFS family permease
MGFLGSTVAVGSIFGPVLDGFLVDSLGWPFIFFINVPIGAVLIAAAHGESPMVVAAVGVFSVLCGTGFVLWEQRAREPLLDLGIFRNRAFTRPLVGMMLAFVASFMMNIAGPFYFQGVMRYTPSQVGLVFLVVPVVTVIASPVSGWLFDKRYWKHYGRLGMAVVALCLLGLGWMAIRIDFAPMMPLFVVFGLGSALFQSPNSTEIMNAFPGRRQRSLRASRPLSGTWE